MQNYTLLTIVSFWFCFSIFPFVQIVSGVFQFVQNLFYSFKYDTFYNKKDEKSIYPFSDLTEEEPLLVLVSACNNVDDDRSANQGSDGVEGNDSALAREEADEVTDECDNRSAEHRGG